MNEKIKNAVVNGAFAATALVGGVKGAYQGNVGPIQQAEQWNKAQTTSNARNLSDKERKNQTNSSK